MSSRFSSLQPFLRSPCTVPGTSPKASSDLRDILSKGTNGENAYQLHCSKPTQLFGTYIFPGPTTHESLCHILQQLGVEKDLGASPSDPDVNFCEGLSSSSLSTSVRSNKSKQLLQMDGSLPTSRAQEREAAVRRVSVRCRHLNHSHHSWETTTVCSLHLMIVLTNSMACCHLKIANDNRHSNTADPGFSEDFSTFPKIYSKLVSEA